LSSFLRRPNAHKRALPSALSEPLLLSVARDLRLVDAAEEADSEAGDSEEGGSLAAPLMLVLSLLFGAKAQPASDMTISESALSDALRVYQLAVEREIVTRITGVGGEKVERTLVDWLAAAKQH
jgi:hypothetical protein